MGSDKGYFTFEGFAPNGCGRCTFRIPVARVQHLERCGPVHKFYEIRSACDVVGAPKLIFEGLRREKQEKSLCYIGRPRVYREGSDHPPYPEMIFTVFITVDRVLFEWGWEKCSGEDPFRLQNTKQRFERQLWPT